MKGKRLAAYLVVGILVGGAALAGYIVVRRTTVYTRVSQTYSMMSLLGQSLTVYRNATLTSVPYLDTDQGPVMNRKGMDQKILLRLDVPVDPTTISDPFSLDESGPFHYWTDGQGWTIWSAGPDRDYDVMKPEVYAAPRDGLLDSIAPYQFDPTNGTFSGGDLIYTYRPAPESGAP